MGELNLSLNKLTLNNFMVQKRSLARQAKDHTIKKLVRSIKKLREKKAGSEKQKEKCSRKADKMVEEVLFMKHLHPDEIMKFALLRKKSFAFIVKNPQAKIEERALCRLADHKSMNSAVTSLRQQHANWAEEIPLLIKGLGVRHREKRLKRLKQIGKLDAYLEKERKNLKLLQEFTEIDIDPHILQQPQSLAKKQSSRSRKRKREGNLEKEPVVGVKRPSVVVAKGSVCDSKEDQEMDGNLDVSVIGKESFMGVKSKIISKESVRKKVTLEDGKRSDELVNVKAMAEGTGSDIEYDNWKSDVDDSEKSVEDDNAEEEEENAKLRHGKIDCGNEGISDEDEIESELDNTADQIHDGSDSDTPLELNVNIPGFLKTKKLVNGRKNSQQTDSGGDVDAEDTGSCSDSDEDLLDFLERSRVKASSALVTSRLQGTAVVQQLDLQKISSGTIGKLSTNKTPCGDSDDEDYFAGQVKGKKWEVKKEKRVKKRGSNFFLGVGNGSAGDEDEESEDESEEEGGNDIGVDTGKYFRRNMFREKADQGVRGRGRGRGGRGRGQEETWKGGSGRGRGRGGRGQSDTRRVGRGKLEGEKEGDLNFKNKFTEEENGHTGSRGRSRGGDDHGQWRGGDRRGQRSGQWRGGEGRGQWRGGDRRGREGAGDGRGSYDRGGQRRGRFRGAFQSDFGNANLTPVSKRSSDVSGKSTKDDIPSGTLLHPSWLAKKRELQTASINSFQGKRMVFDD